MSTAWLGFSLRVARGEDDLRDACAVRAQAYGHHLPQLQAALAQPEAIDRDPRTAVLLCRDKTSGRAIGTARIQRAAPEAAVQIESSVQLPAWLRGRSRAEITRLAILPGADSMVRLMLMKASYLHCLAHQSRWMVIGARSDALVRLYKRLGFTDALDAPLPLAHAGGLQHHILAFDVVAAERTWHQGQHDLYDFMVDTFHPDLQLFDEPDRVAA